MRTLHVEIEESGSDSDLSRSEGKEKPRNVFVATTSDRMKKLEEQGADPDEKLLKVSVDRVMMN